MKLLLFYRTIFLLAIAMSFSGMLTAGEPDKNTLLRVKTETILDPPQDEKGQDKKSKGKKSDEGQKPGNDNQKPQSIKEVPRSMPKLKPKAVTDRIPIKRLPVKIPKKGMRINIF